MNNTHIIFNYGYKGDGMNESELDSIARVTAAHRQRYELVTVHGHIFGKTKNGSYANKERSLYPTVGDFVRFSYNQCGDSMITDTLLRVTYFSRKDPDKNKGEQMIASNFDYVFLTSSLNHDFNTRRFERYLAVAFKSGAVPVFVLTKSDVCDDTASARDALSTLAPNVDCVILSAKTGFGINEMQKYMSAGTTSVFLGSSGVGKSSLINRLAGIELMSTGDIRDDDSKGRHTTTHRELFMLPNGAMVIDTPGMRQLGIWDAQDGVNEAFSDIETLSASCRFSNCTHTHEPGCAVLTAIKNGTLSMQRYERYRTLIKEASLNKHRRLH